MKDISNINECVETLVEVVDALNVYETTETKSQIKTGREDGEDSFYVCDLGDVVRKHKKWLKIFPRIHPFYAMKCNPSEAMLRCLIEMGTGFDCASKAEIGKMLKLGADPKKIIFANPCKQSSHIKFARDSGVTKLVFDNEIELHKIKQLYPNAKLLLRIMTDDSASLCQFSMKYGAHPDSCQDLVKIAKSLGLELIGVSFHVGSGCQDTAAYVKALQLARKIFDHGMRLGFQMNLLDIGGGFPGTDDVLLPVEEIAQVVNNTIEDLFASSKFKHLEIIAEPGRYYAASAFTLATNVIAKRKVTSNKQVYEDGPLKKDAILNDAPPECSEEPSYMYFLNDGLYGSFNCLFYDHAEVKPVVLKNVKKNATRYTSSIWGPTCDGLDRVVENCSLPELYTGDWILWKNMGAYTVAAGSAFNGFKTSAIYHMITKSDLALLSELCDGKLVLSLLFTERSQEYSLCDQFRSDFTEDRLREIEVQIS